MKKEILLLLSVTMIILILTACVKIEIRKKIDTPVPSNHQTVYSDEIELQWEHLGKFEYFEIKLGEASNTLTTFSTTTESTCVVSGLEWGKEYHWQVIGHLNQSEPVLSSIWQFYYGEIHQALVIGITDYDKTSDLSLTDDDAQDMEQAFSHSDLNYHINSLTGRVTKADIAQSISLVTDLNEQSVFTFTYAGHGGYSSYQKESYLYMSDGGKLYMSELRAMLDALPGKKLIIIDACESGNFVNLTPGRITMTKEEMRAAGRQFNSSVIESFTSGKRSTNTEYHIMTAANISQISWENQTLRNGIFSFFFLDGIGDVGEDNPYDSFDFTFNADTNSDQKVTLSESYAYTAPRVEAFVNNLLGRHQNVQVYPLDSDFVITQW